MRGGCHRWRPRSGVARRRGRVPAPCRSPETARKALRDRDISIPRMLMSRWRAGGEAVSAVNQGVVAPGGHGCGELGSVMFEEPEASSRIPLAEPAPRTPPEAAPLKRHART